MVPTALCESSALADKEKILFVALVDGNLVRRNSLRQQLDALGCASLIFDSPCELMATQRDLGGLGCMIVALQGDDIQSKIKAVMERYDSPMLLVTSQENYSALSLLEQSFINSKKVDVIHDSCSRHELNWRLQLLKKNAAGAAAGAGFFNYGIYSFDIKRRQAWAETEKIPLRPLEFELALELFRNINSVLTREKLYALLWDEPSSSVKSRKLDVCISNVRKKMGLEADRGFLLKSIYGTGYELSSLYS